MRRLAPLAPTLMLVLALPPVLAGCASTPRHRPGGAPPPHGLHGDHRPPGADGGHGHMRTFISPMGEPFHGTEAQRDPERQWFDAVDADHDGRITPAEFTADAMRFFALLDRRHDGEIDPDDIDYYESTIAPEVRSGEGGGFAVGAPSDGGSGGSARAPAYDASRLGAARFSYFDLPEPVVAADRNLNRGIDQQEFRQAADQRFAALDRDKDGALTYAELPHVSGRSGRPAAGARGRPGGGHGRGGHGGGMRGMGGAGMGGGGMSGGGMGE